MIPENAIRGFFKSHHPFIDDSDLPRRAEVALVVDVSLDNNDPNILFIQRAECEKDPGRVKWLFRAVVEKPLI